MSKGEKGRKKKMTGASAARTLKDPSRHRPINDLLKFKQKVNLCFERKNFTVKTVSNRRELMQAFMLRYEVFHKEFAGKRFPIGVDTDPYDAFADILVIIDNKQKKVVGTYRLICSQFSDTFYSASEFDLKDFLAQPGIKLELSRACIHRSYRNGIVMNLLWRGLGEYMAAVGARFLFGCSSVKSINIMEIAAVAVRLKEEGMYEGAGTVFPIGEFRMPQFAKAVEELSQSDYKKPTIPSLFQAYLKAGARVWGEPALDIKFRCADFFTVLDRENLSTMHEKKFVGH